MGADTPRQKRKAGLKAVIDGIELNYEREGSGKPVLLLHGWGASIETMRPIAAHLINRGVVL